MKNKKKSKFKNLIKKLKKTNKILRYIFYITLLIYIPSVFLLSYSLIILKNIETIIRTLIILFMLLNTLTYLLLGLLTLISKKNKTLIFLMILTTIFSTINTVGYFYINKTYNIVSSSKKEKVIYTTNLISLDEDVKIKNIGIIKNEEDTEKYILPQEYIVKKDIKAKITYYDEDYELLDALYNKKEDAIFVEGNYIIKYAENEKYQNIKNETVIIDSYSKKLNNKDLVESTNKSVTEPFTVLLLGVDSEYDGLNNNASFNGDSIMLITFNPKTLSTTLFSIPRDTYVPIACNNNKSNKINSAAGYGTKCMINTIENLTGINIDYYVKINFKGVVSLVESLDGITLDIDKPDYKYNLSVNCGDKICEQNSNREFGDKLVYITPGKNQTLNGEQALAYSRNRHQFALSDFKRIEHQQAVVTAILNKTKTIRNLTTFYKVLNSITNNIDTNMETEQILNFYNVGKNLLLNNNFEGNDFISIQKTYLTGYDLNMYLNGSNIYTYQYYEESLKEITKAMKENLELEKPKLIKSFSFSANKEYTVPVIGKNYMGVKKNETLPNFVGQSLEYLNSWKETRNININIKENKSNSCENNKITNQNVHNGTLVSSIQNLEVTVCKNYEEINIPNEEENNLNETNEDSE